MSEEKLRTEWSHTNSEIKPVRPIQPISKTIEIIDHHTDLGRERLDLVNSVLATINEQRNLLSRVDLKEDPNRGFEAAQDEALKTYANYEQLITFLSQFPELQRSSILSEVISTKLLQTLERSPKWADVQVSKEEIVALLQKSDISTELITLMNALHTHGCNAEVIEQGSCYLLQVNEDSVKLVKSVSPELYKWMRWSRFIGLIPFSLLEKLSNERIAVMGTSAAFPTIELLVSLGAGTGEQGWVRIVDDGISKPSFTAKAVGEGSSVFNIGRDKVELLLTTLESTQPFGNFEAYSARVSFDENNHDSKHLPISTFIADSTQIIETVDSPQAKLGINQALLKESGLENTQLIRLADTGLDPVLSFEPAETRDVDFAFGRELTEQERRFFDYFLSLPLEQQTQLVPVAHAAIAAEFITCSPQHFLAFLANPGFLPQTASTSRFTGVVGALKILEMLDQTTRGEKLQPSATRARQLPTYFGEKFNKDELHSLDKIFSILTNGVSNPIFTQS